MEPTGARRHRVFGGRGRVLGATLSGSVRIPRDGSQNGVCWGPWGELGSLGEYQGSGDDGLWIA